MSCPNKEQCGSCKWSHIPYEKQLAQKLSDINAAFKSRELDLTCDRIIPSPKLDHYRNRMDFVINFEGLFGLREKGKWWRVIDNHTCFISDEQIEGLFSKVYEWLKETELSYFDRKTHTGLLRYAVIRATRLGETLITIVTSDPGKENDLVKRELDRLNEIANPTTLVWAINHTISDVSFGDELHVISGDGYIHEEMLDSRYKISPQAFFQTNSYAAPELLGVVSEFVGDVSEKTLMDLYCGSGFFGIHFAKLAKRVVGVEINEEAIRDANENIKLNSLSEKDIAFYDAKTEEFDWMQYHPDIVILDPPRAGLHDDARADLIEAAPNEVIYVSCNYKALAYDLAALKDSYSIIDICAVDMFPHTPHVETVVKLAKK